MTIPAYEVVVIGGGHAGVEAAWAAANLLGLGADGGATVALVTLDASKIGVMSCNPAIGGLAKGQIVREIDALGGLMGLATDATGIQFKVLNSSKGAAVRGPRAQCDKHAYAEAVQAMVASRREIAVIGGSCEGFTCNQTSGADGHQRTLTGVRLATPGGPVSLTAKAVVLTTGTFMRGLMHTGQSTTSGGRFGEAAAVGISAALQGLGFELGRLKTGTPPRLKRGTIDWNGLEEQLGDVEPMPFSDLSGQQAACGLLESAGAAVPATVRFPVLPQVDCRMTSTNAQIHALITANLHRAPMYSGQIESIGPRYCPSIEDKVVRFAERQAHGVYLEPESLRDDWVYCNGVSTSLPADVQDRIVRLMPGCEHAEIYRYGYAVEYDMVRPHQIFATGETKLVANLFLAGQINGTSGYEEAAGQGWIAGANAALRAQGRASITLGRDRAYIGVMMDDLVTRTPVEPYRMFTSRAEYRLLLRADNTADRLTPLADEMGLLATTELGRARRAVFTERTRALEHLRVASESARDGVDYVTDIARRPEVTTAEFERVLGRAGIKPVSGSGRIDARVLYTVHQDLFYSPFVDKARGDLRRLNELEHKSIPPHVDYANMVNMRTEARQALIRFRPATMAQAGRLEGITPADMTLLAVLVGRQIASQRQAL